MFTNGLACGFLICTPICFTNGAVFGRQVFVEDFFRNNCEFFSRKRKTGAPKPANTKNRILIIYCLSLYKLMPAPGADVLPLHHSLLVTHYPSHTSICVNLRHLRIKHSQKKMGTYNKSFFTSQKVN